MQSVQHLNCIVWNSHNTVGLFG